MAETSTPNVHYLRSEDPAHERDPKNWGLIHSAEVFWCNHRQWLEECGYKLRARYQLDWTPSWHGTKKLFFDCEDGQPLLYSHMLDATRIQDGRHVMLKLIQKSDHPHEAEIGQYFSSEPLASNPRNHCIPTYDVLELPNDDNALILVMPLFRRYNDPRFDTFGEVVEYFRQIFEGLQFMHQHNVAHRDCMDLNIMMDAAPLYPEPYHPRKTQMKRDFSGKAKHFTRTERPVKYYLVDFGLSLRFKPEESPRIADPVQGGDKTVPEFQGTDNPPPCDPFPVDVYYLGNMIREDFIKGASGFGFMRPLINDMVQSDPSKRPTMNEVVLRFEKIRSGLGGWKLRSRVVKRSDWMIPGLLRSFSHWTRRIGFIATGVPSTPTP